jgi:hypothetical protein
MQVEAFDELAGGERRQSAAEEADEAVGGGGDRPLDGGTPSSPPGWSACC